MEHPEIAKTPCCSLGLRHQASVFFVCLIDFAHPLSLPEANILPLPTFPDSPLWLNLVLALNLCLAFYAPSNHCPLLMS
jgi:hypothetical protein